MNHRLTSSRYQRTLRAATMAMAPLIMLLPTMLHAQETVQETQLPSSDFGVNERDPVLLVAEELGYDTANKHVIARGNVEISQNLTLLLAQQVTYDEVTQVVTASGDVTVMESTGNVYFADQVVLTDEMKRGTIAYFKGRLADGSIFTAYSAEKFSDTVTKFKKAVYTPCALFCQEDGSPKQPTWAVTASEVEIDTGAQKIEYDNVWVEIYGQKLLYTPRLSHPTPGADNKSGFLSPALQQDENLGLVAAVPYYHVFDQTSDMTITPLFTSKEGPVLMGEYRQRFDRGEMLLSGSATAARRRDSAGNVTAGDGREFRGHIDSQAIYDIDSQWQTGFDLRRVTDDTYLRRYNILQNESLLTSRAYMEGVNPLQNGNDRHYLIAQGLAFQGLTALDNRSTTPTALPLIEYGYTTQPMWAGSRFSIEGSALSITRDEGANSNRITSRFGWNLPYVTNNGHMFDLDTSIRLDGYHITDHTLSDNTQYDGTRARVIPQASLSWRYPLINRLENSNLLVEPIANITSSTIGVNDEEIPNEDNVLPEFTDLNLFSSNRFSGRDLHETGTRLYYGMRGMWDFFENRQIAGSFGQVYRFNNEPLFPLTNDLTTRFSDYVGHLSVQYQPVTLAYRFRFDRDNLEASRQEIEGGLNFNRAGININYLELSDDPFLGDNQEITATGYVKLNDYWTLISNGRRDLNLDRLTNAGVGLQFANECTTLIFGVNRDLINDRDIRDSTRAYFQLILKNLD